MAEESITQDELKKLVHYDPQTGIFTNIKARTWLRPGRILGASHSMGYKVISIYCRKYYAHRLAFLYMNGSFPAREVDHINHDRADNRWSNLRQASRSGNMKNCSRHANNTSGVTGVSFHKPNKKWRAFIGVCGKAIHIGMFDNFNDAVSARRGAELKYGFHPNHGESL